MMSSEEVVDALALAGMRSVVDHHPTGSRRPAEAPAMDSVAASSSSSSSSSSVSPPSTLANGRRRHWISGEQKDILVNAYSRNPFPPTREREALAQQLGLTPRSVQIWFQNQRQRNLQRKRNRIPSAAAGAGFADGLSTPFRYVFGTPPLPPGFAFPSMALSANANGHGHGYHNGGNPQYLQGLVAWDPEVARAMAASGRPMVGGPAGAFASPPPGSFLMPMPMQTQMQMTAERRASVSSMTAERRASVSSTTDGNNAPDAESRPGHHGTTKNGTAAGTPNGHAAREHHSDADANADADANSNGRGHGADGSGAESEGSDSDRLVELSNASYASTVGSRSNNSGGARPPATSATAAASEASASASGHGAGGSGLAVPTVASASGNGVQGHVGLTAEELMRAGFSTQFAGISPVQLHNLSVAAAAAMSRGHGYASAFSPVGFNGTNGSLGNVNGNGTNVGQNAAATMMAMMTMPMWITNGSNGQQQLMLMTAMPNGAPYVHALPPGALQLLAPPNGSSKLQSPSFANGHGPGGGNGAVSHSA